MRICLQDQMTSVVCLKYLAYTGLFIVRSRTRSWSDP